MVRQQNGSARVGLAGVASIFYLLGIVDAAARTLCGTAHLPSDVRVGAGHRGFAEHDPAYRIFTAKKAKEAEKK